MIDHEKFFWVRTPCWKVFVNPDPIKKYLRTAVLKICFIKKALLNVRLNGQKGSTTHVILFSLILFLCKKNFLIIFVLLN